MRCNCLPAAFYWCALALASDFLRPPGAANRILHVFFALRIVILHTKFFAVIHDWRTTERQGKGAHHLRNRVVILPVSVAIVGTDTIVIADHKYRPSPNRIDQRNLAAEFRR